MLFTTLVPTPLPSRSVPAHVGVPVMGIIDDIFKKNPFDDDAKKPLSSGDKPW